MERNVEFLLVVRLRQIWPGLKLQESARELVKLPSKAGLR